MKISLKGKSIVRKPLAVFEETLEGGSKANSGDSGNDKEEGKKALGEGDAIEEEVPLRKQRKIYLPSSSVDDTGQDKHESKDKPATTQQAGAGTEAESTSYEKMVFEDREDSTRRNSLDYDDGEQRNGVGFTPKYSDLQSMMRQKALSRSLFEDESFMKNSKGMVIMAKLGFKVGDTLGVKKSARKVEDEDNSGCSSSDNNSSKGYNRERLSEPLRVNPRIGRSGIGEQLVKDKIALLAKEQEVKDADSYEASVKQKGLEVTQRKTMGQLMKKAFELSGDSDLEDIRSTNPLNINVLWRKYVVDFQNRINRRRIIPLLGEEERKSATLQKAEKSIKDKNVTVNSGSDEDVKLVEGSELPGLDTSDEPYAEEDDVELQDFLEESNESKIEKLVMFLRVEFYFCFWCAVQYESERELYEDCPGPDEEDHI